MINLDVQDDRIEVSVIGPFTLDDYRQFEEAVRYRLTFRRRIDPDAMATVIVGAPAGVQK